MSNINNISEELPSSSIPETIESGDDSALRSTQHTLDLQKAKNTLDVRISITNNGSQGITVEGSFMASIENSNPNKTRRGGKRLAGVAFSRYLCDAYAQIKGLSKIWLNDYQSNPEGAIQSILELILHSMGYKNLLALSGSEFLKLSSLTIEQFNDWMGEAKLKPILPHEFYFTNLSKFMQTIFKEKVLMNGRFMEEVNYLLVIMVDSKWKAARYTASIFGSIITHLYLSFYQKLENGVTLTSTRCSLSLIENVLQSVKPFLKLVVLCLNDVDLFIRKENLEFFWGMCKKYPTLFLNDKYLRNIYWALYDSKMTIRLFAVKACATVFGSGELIDNLERFRENVFPALIARCYDTSEIIAVEAVTAVTAIYRKFPNLFNKDYFEKMFTLLYCGRQKIASATAELFYETLKEHHNDTKAFIKNIILFLDESEESLNYFCEVILMRCLLPFAGYQLTDWQAWTDLLLGNTIAGHLEEVACRLLICVVKNCTTFHFGEYQKNKPFRLLLTTTAQKDDDLTAKEQYELELCELYRSDITDHFSSHLLQLWERYREHPQSLKSLLKIPQHFCNVGSLDMKEIYKYLTDLNYPTCIGESCSSLVTLLRLMKASDQWKGYVPDMEQSLFANVEASFLRSCHKIGNLESVAPNSIHRDLVLIKKACCIMKYFDLTHTNMVKDAIVALLYGRQIVNSKIMSIAAKMCLYVVHWHLEGIEKHNYSEDEFRVKLTIFQTHLRATIMLIEPMIKSTNESIRKEAFTVFCKLHTLFAPRSVFRKNYPTVELPLPSLVVSEWLNFHLYCNASRKGVPKCSLEFYWAENVLEQFCLMLCSGVLELAYISSILPYFLFYDEEKNYNDTLEWAVSILVDHEKFPSELVLSLAFYYAQHTLEKTQVLALGVSIAGISRLNTVDCIQSVAFSIVANGLKYIKTNTELAFFPILTPFVKLMSRDDASLVKSFVLDYYFLHTDNKYVKNFIDALKNTASIDEEELSNDLFDDDE